MIAAKDHRATETENTVNRNSDVRRWHIVMKIMTFLRLSRMCVCGSVRAMNECACLLWAESLLLMFLFIVEKPKNFFWFVSMFFVVRAQTCTQQQQWKITNESTTVSRARSQWNVQEDILRGLLRTGDVCACFSLSVPLPLSFIEFGVIGIIQHYYELPPWLRAYHITIPLVCFYFCPKNAM